MVFDKTGTLTEGELRVAQDMFLADRQYATSLTLGLTSNSKHRGSIAVSSYLKTKDVVGANVKDVKLVTGKGIEGIVAVTTVISKSTSRASCR